VTAYVLGGRKNNRFNFTPTPYPLTSRCDYDERLKPRLWEAVYLANTRQHNVYPPQRKATGQKMGGLTGGANFPTSTPLYTDAVIDDTENPDFGGAVAMGALRKLHRW